MDGWLLVGAGILLLGVTALDVVWTVLAVAAGRGPLTSLVARAAWRVATRRGAETRHRTLQLVGYGILIGVLLLWLGGVWAGFTLPLLSDDNAVVSASNQQPAGGVARAAYALGGLAGAGAGLVAGSGGWQLVNNTAAIVGLALATLTVAYLFQIVTATSHKRALALRILGIADRPSSLAAVGLGQERLGSLGDHLVGLSQDVAVMARYHLALPVLHYLHVGQRAAAIEVAVAVLDEALTIIEAVGDGSDRGITGPVRSAISEFVKTVHIPRPDVGPPPGPDLSPLRDAHRPLPDRQGFQQVLEDLSDRRARLRALVEQNGWHWEQDVDPGRQPAG